MSNHTPGPWIVMNTTSGALSINITPKIPIATIGGMGWHLGEETAHANARLIVAAPELLDLCERLLSFAYEHADEGALLAEATMLGVAQNIIDKAKGA